MDGLILRTTALCFLLFLLSQTVIFRLISQRDTARWLFNIQCIVSGITILVGNICFGLEGPEYRYFIAVTMILLWLLWIIYMMTVYSYIEASITIRLLMEIAARGHRGATKKRILQIYNPAVIVKRRLDRLIQSGELIKTGNVIQATGRVSVFQLRKRITMWYIVLFPRWKGV